MFYLNNEESSDRMKEVMANNEREDREEDLFDIAEIN